MLKVLGDQHIASKPWFSSCAKCEPDQVVGHGCMGTKDKSGGRCGSGGVVVGGGVVAGGGGSVVNAVSVGDGVSLSSGGGDGGDDEV